MKRIFTLICLYLSACDLSPQYEKPEIPTPSSFKEGETTWAVATPSDFKEKGSWWDLFNAPLLNQFHQDLLASNYSIEAAKAQYLQSLEVMGQAKSSYFPSLSVFVDDTRSKAISSKKTVISNTGSVSFQASWEPDLWGSISNTVLKDKASSEAYLAQVASTRLSAQASLTQYYFQLRILDEIQDILDEAVKAYDQYLNLLHQQVKQGTAYAMSVLQAKSQQNSMLIQSVDNGMLRAQYEHAIAVLLGKNPSTFTIKKEKTTYTIPRLPLVVPSELLQRRPDIANAQRAMVAANAQIGIDKAAYFPSITLSGSRGAQLTSFARLFTSPNLVWSLGAQLTQSIFQGGKQLAQVEASKQAYKQQVATYKQTVLSAFQEVEDALSNAAILDQEMIYEQEALEASEKQLLILKNQFAAGTASLVDTISTLFTVFTARQTYITLKGKRLQASVSLIKVLGGGFQGVEQELSNVREKI